MKLRSSILFALVWFDLGIGAVETWHWSIEPVLLHSLWLMLMVFFIGSTIADVFGKKAKKS